MKKAQKQQNIINRKVITAANKQKKKTKKLKKTKITTKRRSAKITEIQFWKEAKKTTKAYYQQQSTLPISSTIPIKAKTPCKGRISKPHPPIIILEVEVAVLIISQGQRIQQPQHFNI